jgi:hypothetical protein
LSISTPPSASTTSLKPSKSICTTWLTSMLVTLRTVRIASGSPPLAYAVLIFSWP